MKLELGVDSIRLYPESRLDSELLERWQKRPCNVEVAGKDQGPTGHRGFDQLRLEVTFARKRVEELWS
jgi:hypothetical protein